MSMSSFDPAEVVGLYGLVGSGVSEIADSIYGIDHADAGRILLDGQPVAPRSPRHAQRLGIGLLPADRKKQGMFSFQSIMFNISSGHLPLLSKLRRLGRSCPGTHSRQGHDLQARGEDAEREPADRGHVGRKCSESGASSPVGRAA